MALSTTYFDPMSQLSPKSPNFALQIVVLSSKHTVSVIVDAHCANFFLHNLGTGSSLPKTTFRAKINGSLACVGEHVKIWDPVFISATVEANSFKFGIQVGLGELGSSLPRNNF